MILLFRDCLGDTLLVLLLVALLYAHQSNDKVHSQHYQFPVHTPALLGNWVGGRGAEEGGNIYTLSLLVWLVPVVLILARLVSLLVISFLHRNSGKQGVINAHCDSNFRCWLGMDWAPSPSGMAPGSRRLMHIWIPIGSPFQSQSVNKTGDGP